MPVSEFSETDTLHRPAFRPIRPRLGEEFAVEASIADRFSKLGLRCVLNRHVGNVDIDPSECSRKFLLQAFDLIDDFDEAVAEGGEVIFDARWNFGMDGFVEDAEANQLDQAFV